jgi:hypothetical protein
MSTRTGIANSEYLLQQLPPMSTKEAAAAARAVLKERDQEAVDSN